MYPGIGNPSIRYCRCSRLPLWLVGMPLRPSQASGAGREGGVAELSIPTHHVTGFCSIFQSSNSSPSGAFLLHPTILIHPFQCCIRFHSIRPRFPCPSLLPKSFASANLVLHLSHHATPPASKSRCLNWQPSTRPTPTRKYASLTRSIHHCHLQHCSSWLFHPPLPTRLKKEAQTQRWET